MTPSELRADEYRHIVRLDGEREDLLARIKALESIAFCRRTPEQRQELWFCHDRLRLVRYELSNRYLRASFIVGENRSQTVVDTPEAAPKRKKPAPKSSGKAKGKGKAA
jgi:hypothetical protein